MFNINNELKELKKELKSANIDLKEHIDFKNKSIYNDTMVIRFHINALNLYIKELKELIYFYEN